MMKKLLIMAAVMASISPLISGSQADPGVRGVEDLVALLTDYGTTGFYAGALEGSIYSANPEARISTITHQVSAFDVAEGSYILAQAAREFPPGTVFAAEVDPGVGGGARAIVLVTADGKLFVGPDNGLFSGVMEDLGIASIREITDPNLTAKGKTAAFRGVGIYGPVAGRLSAGMDPTSIGPEISDPVRIEARRGGIEDGAIVGTVALVDHFGNLVTDIPGELADEAGLAPEDGVEIALDGEVVEATFGRTYADVPAGEWVLFAGPSGRLEIAINMDSAAEAVEATPGTTVQVRKI
ncbi:MAG: Chlorinase [Methanothrix sp.]|jgi:hypothetical protein|nr:MAG: Chlorinase [Methanothrix sp.]